MEIFHEKSLVLIFSADTENIMTDRPVTNVIIFIMVCILFKVAFSPYLNTYDKGGQNASSFSIIRNSYFYVDIFFSLQ